VRARVWCENLPYDELPAQLPLLARYGVELLLAVRPWQLAEIGDLVRRVGDAGVFVGVWPMLADEDGRWASAHSYAKFIALADEVSARAPEAGELVIDLEPPFAQLARWKAGRPARPLAGGFRVARESFIAAARHWRARHRVTSAVLPFIAFERRGEWLQRLLGTPTTSLDLDAHNVMAYTSLFEGWSRGVLDRRRAEALLAACARATHRRFGSRAALSLGTVGGGAFGDEPCYRDPHELARDVALARAAGITELALFDLTGIVHRAPAEAWLEAFVG
jgi:hypothetical protein